MDDLRERIEAVERAITDTEGDKAVLATDAASAQRVDSLEADLAALRDDVAELEAATQALRGYVGRVRADTESADDRTADAVAAADTRPSAPTAERDPTDSQRPSADAGLGRPAERCGECGRRPAADGGNHPSDSRAGTPTGRRRVPERGHRFGDNSGQAAPGQEADEPAATGLLARLRDWL